MGRQWWSDKCNADDRECSSCQARCPTWEGCRTLQRALTEASVRRVGKTAPFPSSVTWKQRTASREINPRTNPGLGGDHVWPLLLFWNNNNITINLVPQICRSLICMEEVINIKLWETGRSLSNLLELYHLFTPAFVKWLSVNCALSGEYCTWLGAAALDPSVNGRCEVTCWIQT